MKAKLAINRYVFFLGYSFGCNLALSLKEAKISTLVPGADIASLAF